MSPARAIWLGGYVLAAYNALSMAAALGQQHWTRSVGYGASAFGITALTIGFKIMANALSEIIANAELRGRA